MAIINCTPDSFSDGGRHLAADDAIRAAIQAEADGAAWLDIGGESSRPGAEPVSADEEQRRVLPVLVGLREKTSAILSLDTCKAAVAHAGLAAGADVINDISGGRDPELVDAVIQAHAGYILMHMQGTPASMQQQPRYDDVVDEVLAFFQHRLDTVTRRGMAEEAVVLDPGIGFGKRPEHNLALLRAMPRLHALGRPLLIGLSRKSVLPPIFGRDLPVAERDHWSHLLHARLADQCAILRVHDVPGTCDAVRAALALSAEVGP